MKKHNVLTAVCCLLTLAICAQAQNTKNNSKEWKLTPQQQEKLEQILKQRNNINGEVMFKNFDTQKVDSILNQIGQKNIQNHSKEWKLTPQQQEKLEQILKQRNNINGEVMFKSPEAQNIERLINQKKQDQLKFQKALEEARQKAAKKSAEQSSGNTCAACGEEVRPGQHCSATGYNTMCSSSKEEPSANNTRQDSGVCPKCGKALSIDERYHGVEHKCQKAQEPANTCAACGEEVRPGQHCSATGYASLCSSSKNEPKQEKIQTNYNGGDPHANEVF